MFPKTLDEFKEVNGDIKYRLYMYKFNRNVSKI